MSSSEAILDDNVDKPYEIMELFPMFRRLTLAQRAAIAVDSLPLFEEEAKKIQTDRSPSGPRKVLKRLQQRLAGEALDVSLTSVRRAEEVKLRNVDVFYDMKAGTITMEDARRKTGTWRRGGGHKPTRHPEPEPPKPVRVHKSIAARAERAKRIEALALEGHRALQIAEVTGLHEMTVRRIAADYSIELPDQVCGRARRLFDVNRCTEQAVMHVAQLRTFLNLIRASVEGLDQSQIADWVRQLKDSRRAISELITLLNQEGDNE